MKRIIFFFLMGSTMCLLQVIAGYSADYVNGPTKLFVTHYENVLGTSMIMKTYAKSEAQSEMAEGVALDEITRLSKILSVYDSESEVSKWLKTVNKTIVISDELFQVLSLFDEWRDRTNGALDASVGVMAKRWKESAMKGEIPSESSLKEAFSEVKQIHWKLDAKSHTAIHLSNAPLILNSFVKSYILQSAAELAMISAKLNGIILNIGGDIIIAGDVKEKVAVSDPKAAGENDKPIALLEIKNKAVATSGSYRRGEKINGQWYSHIIDPRTGLPCDEILSVTVIAASATDAGALATTFNVLTPTESISLASTFSDIEYLIITKNGERFQSKNWASLNFSDNLIERVTAPLEDITFLQKDWKNELVINLDLTLPPGNARRPFAAFWIEDNEKNTIRTIALWYNKARWLPDVRDWYRKNGKSMIADPALYASITSATRSPGKYTLKWDGKDDKGISVKPGIYTVFLEVVREHGGYDLIHQEIDCSNAPQSFTVKGSAEINSALIEFRKKVSDN